MTQNIDQNEVNKFADIAEKWWDGLNPEERTQWYQRQHSLKKGEKRKCEISVVETSTKKAYLDGAQIDEFIPFPCILGARGS